MEGQHAQTIWEASVIPALAGFALCVGVIVFSWWRPAPRPGPWRPLTPTLRTRLLLGTGRLVFAGTVAFYLVVLAFSVILQHEPEAVTAVWAAPFLLACTLPLWFGLTWLANRRARRTAGSGPAAR